MIEMPRIYISAIKKSSGKTTISIALSRLLYNNGYSVLTFKKGPDYIDPMWLECASHKHCYNLDFFFLKDKVFDYFIDKFQSSNSNFCLIEGNHGLFDDIHLDGRTSNAQLARITKTPVLFVIDVSEMGRSLAALLQGCVNFESDINIAGVILNKIQSKRQEDKLTQVIKNYTNLKILGAIPNSDLNITQRHLGLTSTLTNNEKNTLVEQMADFIKPYIDLSAVINIARLAPKLNTTTLVHNNCKLNKNIRMALAFDEAFNFYYNENLESLEKSGVELKKFSPLYDEGLPELDAIYIGGGFPELFIKKLESNSGLRERIKKLSDEGLPIYAECGGLMYLANKIEYKSKISNMCGVFDFHAKLSKKPIGHGYTVLSPKNKDNFLGDKKIYAHEFHYGFLENLDNLNCFFNVERGFGINGNCDGAISKNSIAMFSHIFDFENNFFCNWLKHYKLDS